MPTPVNSVEALATQEYKYGFYTDFEADNVPPGLNEDIIRLISAKKNKPSWLLAGVAVDAVFDSVSVGTTFKKKLGELGIIFCSFSEAVQEHPELVRKWLGSVVPYTDNFFATLNAAVFTDGSFCYVPKGVRCPMELSTYFRINAKDTGQFERTLIIAEDGAYVSYLEGCLPGWEEVSCGDQVRSIRDIAIHDAVLNDRGEEAQ